MPPREKHGLECRHNWVQIQAVAQGPEGVRNLPPWCRPGIWPTPREPVPVGFHAGPTSVRTSGGTGSLGMSEDPPVL